MEIKDGQKVLDVKGLTFFLAEDFKGDIIDALESAIAYHRSKQKISIVDEKYSWESAWDSFVNENKRLTGYLSLSEYNKENNRFERISPSSYEHLRYAIRKQAIGKKYDIFECNDRKHRTILKVTCDDINDAAAVQAALQRMEHQRINLFVEKLVESKVNESKDEDVKVGGSLKRPTSILWQEAWSIAGKSLFYMNFLRSTVDWKEQKKRICQMCYHLAQEWGNHLEDTPSNREWFENWIEKFENEVENQC